MTKQKKNKKIYPTEHQIQEAILEWLGLHRVKAWRNNTGVMFSSYKGKKRMVRFGFKGCSDIFGIIKSTGRFLAIEVKDHKGKVSPEQLQFLMDVEDCGGLAFVARNLEDVEKKFSTV